jgi:hypothetical protein
MAYRRGRKPLEQSVLDSCIHPSNAIVDDCASATSTAQYHLRFARGAAAAIGWPLGRRRGDAKAQLKTETANAQAARAAVTANHETGKGAARARMRHPRSVMPINAW